ncbi:MAG: hypothetical protein CSH37_05645 [Thalassolituus sp.]|nr:MAG: hypothetical protein CSH37_05645 [Thalassolituus sp.]
MPLRRQLPVVVAMLLLSLSAYGIAVMAQPITPFKTALLVLVAAVVVWLVSVWSQRWSNQKQIADIQKEQQLATLGDAAAGVGHEINNPLAYVSSNLSGLADDIEAYNAFIEVLDSASDHLEIRNPFYQKALMAYQSLAIADTCDAAPARVNDCLQGIHHIERVINDMQALSRSTPVELQLGDVNANISAVIDIVRTRLPDDVQLDVELIQPPQMLCHPPRFAQVVMNMLINGLHALSDKPGRLSLRQYQTADIFYTEIADDGCGMSSDVQARIFEPFFTTRAEGKGAGIGLALCYKLIEEHQGSITVDSRPGEGARFTLALPVRNGDKDNAD